MINLFATAAPRESLVRTTKTHVIVSYGFIVGLLLPADGDRVLTGAIAVASVLTAATLFVGLVVIPRRVRRQSTT